MQKASLHYVFMKSVFNFKIYTVFIWIEAAPQLVAALE